MGRKLFVFFLAVSSCGDDHGYRTTEHTGAPYQPYQPEPGNPEPQVGSAATRPQAVSAPPRVEVHGYTRANGTTVHGYSRSR